MNIKHSANNPNWLTPQNIIEDARLVLGSIDLDPASDDIAQTRVKAARYITEKENGLTADWGNNVSVFLNSPGGAIPGGRKSLTGLFWQKLMNFRAEGNLNHAIVIGFSIEILQMTQNYHELSPLDFAICVPKQRIKFELPPDIKEARLAAGKKDQPSHANVIIYVNGGVNGSIDNSLKFKEIFGKYGKVKL